MQWRNEAEFDPRDPDAHYVLSLAARFYRGQRQRADEALRHCLRLSSSYAPAYGLLAQSSNRSGQRAEASLATLRQHPAFCSLEAIRVTLVRTFDPACLGLMERLLDTLREAGLPAQ